MKNFAFVFSMFDLSKFLANRPQYFVHRDFHSKNIMLKESKLIVIDFQDARLGPCSYDLVSLCYDPYVPLNVSQRQVLFESAESYFSNHLSSEIADEVAITQKAVMLQRLLKALGSFAYLTCELKRGDYLKYCSTAIECLKDTYDHRWPYLTGRLIEKLNTK